MPKGGPGDVDNRFLGGHISLVVSSVFLNPAVALHEKTKQDQIGSKIQLMNPVRNRQFVQRSAVNKIIGCAQWINRNS